jgi:hypothetical protein
VEEGEQTSSWLGVADQQGPGNTGGSTRVMLGGNTINIVLDASLSVANCQSCSKDA